ncbi:hypothetical protein FQR65_LT16249 [Abscondita terminalis]|nr:hypothetical protein FQR65_LT16249 [Abscondita terminalis]
MKALAVMPPDIIKDLVPNAGDRSILLYNLREWRLILQTITETEKHAELNDDAVNVAVEIDLASSSSCSDLVCSERLSEILLPAESNSGRKEDTSVCESISSSNLEETEQHHQSTINEVNSILKGTPSGRALLAQFGTTELLDQRSRKRLCHLIVDSELVTDPEKKIPSSRFHTLAYQITTIFKGEHLATYFVPYMSFGPGLRRLAKGKLLDCVNNRRKLLRVSGVITPSRRVRKSSSISRSPTPSRVPPGLEGYENDSVIEHEVVQESVRWLHNSTDPWQMLEGSHNLLSFVKACDGTTISEYFQDYPALKRPTGYLLLLKDFGVVYPAAVNKLYEKLPLYKNKLHELARKKALLCKETTEKEQLDNTLRCENEEEDKCNLGSFLCLPYLLSVKTLRKKKGTWRPSRVETRDSFITVVAADNLVQETVTRRRSKLQGLGLTLQPFTIAVGPSLVDINTYFVVVDDVLYQLPTSVAAVDCCFKIIIQLNAEYPTESSLIWAFIQEGFYELTTPYDKKYTAVSTLLSELSIKT